MARHGDTLNSVVFATGGGCAPIIHTIRLPLIRFPLCPKTMETAFDYASQPEVHTVLIGAAWNVHFSDYNQELLFDTGTERLAFPAPAVQDLAFASFEQSVSALRKLGKRVYIVLQPPSGHVFDPRRMYQGSRFDSIRPLPQIPNLDVARFNQESALPRSRLQAIAAKTGAIIIDPIVTLCPKNVCPVLDQAGVPIYTDPLHMRPSYVRKAITYLDQTVSPPTPPAALVHQDR